MANNNINWNGPNNIINVNGTIIDPKKLVDAKKYADIQPVDPNSSDPFIKNLYFIIDSGTGQVKYINGGKTHNNLNDYAANIFKGPGYTPQTTRNIQFAMQRRLAEATNQTTPPQAPPGTTGTIPSSQGNIFDIFSIFQDGLKDIANLKFESSNEDKLFPVNALLKYPRDILENQQDTLQIQMFNYKAPLGETFINPDVKTADIFIKGLQRNSALKKPLGTVILPIPGGIQDNNAVSWGDDSMNNLTAGVAAYGINNLGGLAGQQALSGLASFAASLKGFNLPTGTINQIFAIRQAGGLTNNPLVKTALTSLVLKNAGVEISPETILARGAGIVPNSNLELLFQGPTLRQFQFSWRMSPRSKEEAANVKRIIRFFKQGSAPRKLNSTSGAGAASLFLGTPNVFKLSYKKGDEEISGLNKFKICALTGMNVVYAPDGQWSAYEDSQPVSLTMTLNFQEIEPVYESDYQSTIFENKPDHPDYSPVGLDDVGY